MRKTMSYWPIVFIALAIIMAIGPIMMMQPSGRDKRLAGLRQGAATLGLQVRMSDYEGNSVAVYSLAVDLDDETQAWKLIKKSYAHGIHFYQKWQLVESSASIPASLEAPVKSYIDNLSSDIVGVEVNSKMVGLWWQEQHNTVTIGQIKSSLKKLSQIVSQGISH